MKEPILKAVEGYEKEVEKTKKNISSFQEELQELSKQKKELEVSLAELTEIINDKVIDLGNLQRQLFYKEGQLDAVKSFADDFLN